MGSPFTPFRQYLEWLDSPAGIDFRRSQDGEGTESDVVTLIPTPQEGGRRVFTMGDLRALVRAGTEWEETRRAWGLAPEIEPCPK